jgi:AbrB family looped-hinge helix DNA binding protein
MRLTISSKGWVVIPADLRKKYGLRPGDAVNIVDYAGVLALVPALKDPVRDAMGMFKSTKSVSAEVAEKHRQEVERDRHRAG